MTQQSDSSDRVGGGRSFRKAHPPDRFDNVSGVLSRGLKTSVAFGPLLLMCGAMMGAAPVQALPLDGNVVAGSASIVNTSAQRMDIVQSTSKAVIDWRSFGVGLDEHVNFDQQAGAGSITLNRVTGNDASVIAGRLTANGSVWLLNTNGVMFSQSAQVDVGGLLATTSHISNADFMAGDFRFTDSGSNASVVNAGSVTVRDGGLAAFVAPHVQNSGVIVANSAKVALAGGDAFTVDLYGDGLINLAVSDKDVNVTHSGTIQANEGKVMITAKTAASLVDHVINVSGLIEAKSFSQNPAGEIILDAEGGQARVYGTMDASSATGDAGRITVTTDNNLWLDGTLKATSATGNGGTIDLDVGSLNQSGTIDASGALGGGDITVNAQTSIEALHSARVFANGAAGGTITHNAHRSIVTSGTYTATGSAGAGGYVGLGGSNVSLLGATVDASGSTVGGTINVGGEWQGGKNIADRVDNSYKTVVSGGMLRANGAQAGGEIAVWSDGVTHFYGSAEALSGGRIEVSGLQGINLSASAAARLLTDGGEVLLDPENLIIQDAPVALAMAKLAFSLAGSEWIIANSDQFGRSVALNDTGNILAVGAYTDDTGGTDRGAAYIFELNAADLTATPTLKQKITHGVAGLTLTNSDNFGHAVALNGTGGILAVAAHSDDTGGTDRGAVYTFDLNTTSLTVNGNYKQKIANGVANLSLANSDQFGSGIALNGAGNILAIGAYGDDTGGADRGALYTFELDTTNLTVNGNYKQKLANGVANLSFANTDQFGSAVALNGAGNVMVVGAYTDDTGGSDRGAVYTFDLDTTALTVNGNYKQKIAHGVGSVSSANSARFGTSVALNATGNILAVGARGDTTGGTDRGAVWTFDLNTTNMTINGNYKQKIADGTAGLSFVNGDKFGSGVALNGTGNILAVGTYTDDTGGTDRGATYLLNLDTTALTVSGNYKQKIANGTGLINQPVALTNNFGSAVALSNDGTALAVGASYDETGGMQRGAAYLFQMDPGSLSTTPVLTQKLAHGTAGLSLANSDRFGTSVALNSTGNILAVGARGDATGGSGRGAVYTFAIDTPALTVNGNYKQKLAHGTAGLSFTNSDNFGSSVALNDAGNILAVGAWTSDAGGLDLGAAYTFELDTTALTVNGNYKQLITHGVANLSLATSDGFGSAIALNGAGNILAVGAYSDDTGGSGRGAVYLFGLDTTAKTVSGNYTQKVAHGVANLNLVNSDQLGFSVALNSAGDIMAVGANGDDTGGSTRGAVYMFDVNTTTKTVSGNYTQKIAHGTSGLTLVNSDQFGSSVAVNGSGTLLAVGAGGDDTGWTDRGAVHLFDLGRNTATDDALFATDAGMDRYLTPAAIEAILNAGNNLTLQANNDITVVDDITVNNAGGDGGDLTLQAGRSILIQDHITTDNGDLTLIANANLADGVVDAYRSAGDAEITVSNGINLALGTGALNVTMAAGTGKTHRDIGAITLRDITAGAVTLSTAEDVSFSGTTTVAGNIDINSGITTMNAVTTTGGGTFTLTNTGAAALNGAFSLDGAFNQDGAGAVTLGGDIATTNDNIGFSGALTLGAARQFTAGTGDISFGGTVNGAHALTIVSADDLSFTGIVGGSAALTGLTVTAVDDIVFSNTLNVAGAVDINTATGTFNAVNTTGGGTFTLTNTGAASFSGAVSLDGAFNQDGAGAVTLSHNIATTNDNIGFSGAVTLGANSQLTAGTRDITFNSTLNGAHTLTIASGDDLTFTGAVGGSTALAGLTITTADDVLFSNSLAAAGNIDINAATATFNAVTTTGGGTFTLTNTGAATLGGAMNLDGAFNQDGAGAVDLGGNITTTNDNATFTGDVTLSANRQVSTGAGAGNILFSGTVNGAQELTLLAGTGNISFASTIGNSVSLTALTITSANDVAFAADADMTGDVTMTAIRDLSLAAGVDLSADDFLIGTARNVTLANTATLDLASFTQSAGTGTTEFGLAGITTTGDLVAHNSAVQGNMDVGGAATFTKASALNLTGLIQGAANQAAANTITLAGGGAQHATSHFNSFYIGYVAAGGGGGGGGTTLSDLQTNLQSSALKTVDGIQRFNPSMDMNPIGQTADMVVPNGGGSSKAGAGGSSSPNSPAQVAFGQARDGSIVPTKDFQEAGQDLIINPSESEQQKKQKNDKEETN